MPAPISFSSGNLTLSDFVAKDSTSGSNTGNSVFAYDAFNSTPSAADGSFVFDWGSSTDASGNANTAPEVIAGSGSATDAWTLNVSFSDFGTHNGETLLYGSGGSEVTIDAGSAHLFSGVGEANLQTLVQGLRIDGNDQADSTVQVTFGLTDTSDSGGLTTLSEKFNANNIVSCYLAGTRIAVPTGEQAIETLRAGDLVMTTSGVAKPIKWIGRHTYTAALVAANAQLRPVMVRKDALAAGMPHRDLMVSPMHSLFIDDVFIPAASLVNGVSILRSDELMPAAYIHLELDEHDVIFAEGAPAETYVDDNNRLMFENADEYYDQFGATGSSRGFSATRLEDGYQLEAIRARLAARAGLSLTAKAPGSLVGHVERIQDGQLQGWIVDSANPAIPVELEVLVDGEMVARVLANRYRIDLDRAGFAGGRCGFTLAMPAAATSIDQVEVRRAADGHKLVMPKTAALVD